MLSQNKGYFWNHFFVMQELEFTLKLFKHMSNTLSWWWTYGAYKTVHFLLLLLLFSLYIFEWLLHGMSVVGSMDSAGIYLVLSCTVRMLLILMTADWSFDLVIDRLWFLWWCVLSVYASINIFNMCIQWWLYFTEIFIQFSRSRK